MKYIPRTKFFIIQNCSYPKSPPLIIQKPYYYGENITTLKSSCNVQHGSKTALSFT